MHNPICVFFPVSDCFSILEIFFSPVGVPLINSGKFMQKKTHGDAVQLIWFPIIKINAVKPNYPCLWDRLLGNILLPGRKLELKSQPVVDAPPGEKVARPI